MQSLLYGFAVLAGGREMLMKMCRSDAVVVEQRFAGLVGRSTAGRP
jgi:hypothetical protein